jgi:hypothetical protein
VLSIYVFHHNSCIMQHESNMKSCLYLYGVPFGWSDSHITSELMDIAILLYVLPGSCPYFDIPRDAGEVEISPSKLICVVIMDTCSWWAVGWSCLYVPCWGGTGNCSVMHLPPFSSVLLVFLSYLCHSRSSVGLILSWSKHYLSKFILEDVVPLLPEQSIRVETRNWRHVESL